MHRRYISNNKIAVKFLFKVTFIIFFKENSFLLFLQEIVIKREMERHRRCIWNSIQNLTIEKEHFSIVLLLVFDYPEINLLFTKMFRNYLPSKNIILNFLRIFIIKGSDNVGCVFNGFYIWENSQQIYGF